jgi:Fibrinogen beta and gamma chains, C-terminal globular domain
MAIWRSLALGLVGLGGCSVIAELEEHTTGTPDAGTDIGNVADASEPSTDAPVPDGPSDALGRGVPTTCAELLANAPSTVSGVFTIDPDGVGPQPPFEAFCDMGTEDGGWTLLITLAPATVTTEFNSPVAWPTTVSVEPGPPTRSGLYQGTLAPFHDVREEIASGEVTVYGRNKTLAELETIRKQYGSASRMSSAPNLEDRPACRLSYAAPTDSLIGCCQFSGTNNASILGWTRDPDPAHNNGCWFARGSGGSTAGGSSQCDGEVNGTRWARTWFR